MTTKDFAAHIGVSPKTINNAENDSHAPRKIVINAWALATGVPVEWLHTGVTPGPDDGDGLAVTPKERAPLRSVAA